MDVFVRRYGVDFGGVFYFWGCGYFRVVVLMNGVVVCVFY